MTTLLTLMPESLATLLVLGELCLSNNRTVFSRPSYRSIVRTADVVRPLLISKA